MSKYTVWYLDSAGNRLAYISDWASLEYVNVLGGIGTLSITTPRYGQLYDQTVPDRQIAVYRQPVGGISSLENLSFLRIFQISTTLTGQTILSSQGYTANELLSRRIVPYYAGSAESQKTDAADDMMKEIFTENFLTDSDYSGGTPERSFPSQYTVQTSVGIGPSVTMGFSWRNTLSTFQNIQAASKELGTEVFFDLTAVSEGNFEFRTWTASRDRTSGSAEPVIFSMEYGNLVAPLLQYDYSDTQNAIYAGGQGEGPSRTVETSTDAARIGVSQLNRREGFAYSRGSLSATVADDARDQLEIKRPLVTIQGTLLDTPLTPYGGVNGWDLGDKVTINYAGQQFDVIIKSVRVRVASDGKETIEARIEDVNS